MAKIKKRRLEINPKLTSPYLSPAATPEEETARKMTSKMFDIPMEDMFTFRDLGDKWRVVTVNGKKFDLPKESIKD
jgi:hypothetical protein